MALGAEESEEFGGVDGDALSTRPLRQELGEETKVDAVEVVGHKEHFFENTLPALAKGCFFFFMELLLDFADFSLDVRVLSGKTANASKIGDGFFVLTNLDEKSGGFVVEEREDQDDAGEHDVDGGGNDPLVCGSSGDV